MKKQNGISRRNLLQKAGALAAGKVFGVPNARAAASYIRFRNAAYYETGNQGARGMQTNFFMVCHILTYKVFY
jgi:hypothetical protein